MLQIEAADIGRILKARIGHDGTGMFSGWFLDKVSTNGVSTLWVILLEIDLLLNRK